MKKLNIILIYFTLLSLSLFAQGNAPHLVKKGIAIQLIVKDQPFLMLGSEPGNSTASSLEDMKRVCERLQAMNLNTMLVPAYWDLIEPEEGKFDFTLIDGTMDLARKYELKIVFLWFGAWKNSMSCYAPLWFKQNYKKYPRAYTKAGKPLEIASSFSGNVKEVDNRAFSQLMKHIAAIDKDNTVIMMQIENEIGMLEDARYYSKEANALFRKQVSETLMDYLTKNKKDLHPWLAEKWQKQENKTNGAWHEIFGDDLYTDKLFMAWSYAQYLEKLAQSARSIHDIPLYVNAAMNSRGRKPGEYPSASPLAHLIDIWHCGAPSIDLLAPDLYDNGFTNWVTQYRLHNNPLFISEVKLGKNNGVQAFYVFGEHDAIGYCPFSIENGAEDAPLTEAYSKLRELIPLLTRYQGRGQSKGLLFDQENKESILQYDDLKITCRHFFTLPWDSRATDGSIWLEAGGLILRLTKDEYIIVGSGIFVEFEKAGEKKAINTKDLGENGFMNQGGQQVKQVAWDDSRRAGIRIVDEIIIIRLYI